jgi:hypothetical protein
MFNGRRQPSCDGTSRMTRECQVRICERLGVKFPGPTRQTEKSRQRDGTAGLPSVADIFDQCRHGRFVPIPDSCGATDHVTRWFQCYSITSLALDCSVSGTSRPSAIAALRLITSRGEWPALS